MRGVDHFLRYPSYVQTPAELLLGVVSILGLVLEMIALSLGPLLLYVLVLGRPRLQTFTCMFSHQFPSYVFWCSLKHSNVFIALKTQYLCVFMHFIHIF